MPTPCAATSVSLLDRDRSGFGCGVRDPGPLHQNDGGYCQGAGDHAKRQPGEIRQGRQWQSGGNGSHIRDTLDRLGVREDDHSCRDHQCDDRAEQPKPRPPKQGQQSKRRKTGGKRGPCDLRRCGKRVDGLGHRGVADGFDAQQVGYLAKDDVDCDAGQETEHHRMRYESEIPPDME